MEHQQGRLIAGDLHSHSVNGIDEDLTAAYRSPPVPLPFPLFGSQLDQGGIGVGSVQFYFFKGNIQSPLFCDLQTAGNVAVAGEHPHNPRR